MKVLVTGAFGNVGTYTLQKLLAQGYSIRCFDLKTKRNQKTAHKFRKRVEIFWGDIRDKKLVEQAVREQDIVIHLASILPPMVNTKPKFAWEVNVEGLANLLSAIKIQWWRKKYVNDC